MGQIKELTRKSRTTTQCVRPEAIPLPLYGVNSMDIKSPLHMHQVQQIIYYSNNKDQARRKTQ